MWPLYFLLNKILGTEEEEEKPENEGDDHDHAECCALDLPPCRDVALPLPASCFVEVPHIKQQFSWDCGLACVLMVLATIGVDDCSFQSLAGLICTTSIWTVDLAYLLKKFSVGFSYLTVTFGANPNYSVESYYKEHLHADLVRVDMLFQKAVEAGINIECRSIGGTEISHWILSGKYIAIALVDQYKLRSWLKNIIIPEFHGSDIGYSGHYIVICGYDAVADEFEIRDPASSWKHERISSRCLEESRKSFGTDEDFLLISLEESQKQNKSLA